MKKMLVASLIASVALLGVARPAKAGNTAGAILTGVAVGIGAALILDALTPPPVVAAPAVVYPPPPVVYQPAPVLVHTPPPVVVTPAPVIYSPATVVYRAAPMVVYAPRHVVHGPPYRRGHWKHASHHRH